MRDFSVRYIYFLSALIFLTGLGLLFWFGWNYFSTRTNARMDAKVTEDTLNVESQKEECAYRRILDGICVQSASSTNPRLAGVMIDNHPDALPQAGLDKASVVYEASVEGSFTRFLALFPLGEEVTKAGPVRSARSYYLDWLSEYGAVLYLHVGGSPEALDLIKQKNILDYNEFYNGQYYWRDAKRTAPHNVFIDSNEWQKIWDKNSGLTLNIFSGWVFATDSTYVFDGGELISEKISLPFNAKYAVEWRYVSSTKQYERFQYGDVHALENGAKIFADTVIVQKTAIKIVDEEGRKQIDTASGGQAVVYIEGRAVVGSWSKGKDNRTRFYKNNGKEIKLKPGKIWVEVVSSI